MTKDKTVTMSRELELFESILCKKPDAFLHEPVYQVTESEVLEFARLLAAPVVERQPFRFLVKSCYGPRSKSIENADESMRESIESARQYFGAENEIDADKAKSLVYISPGEWFAIPLYTSPPAPVALTQAAIDRIVPSLSPEPGREEFHCEWALWSDRERIRAKLAQLLTANLTPAPVAVPEGWKLVPVEPTELMIRRGDQNYSWSVAKIYKAMIDDAPACLDNVKEMNQ